METVHSDWKRELSWGINWLLTNHSMFSESWIRMEVIDSAIVHRELWSWDGSAMMKEQIAHRSAKRGLGIRRTTVQLKRQPDYRLRSDGDTQRVKRKQSNRLSPHAKAE